MKRAAVKQRRKRQKYSRKCPTCGESKLDREMAEHKKACKVERASPPGDPTGILVRAGVIIYYIIAGLHPSCKRALNKLVSHSKAHKRYPCRKDHEGTIWTFGYVPRFNKQADETTAVAKFLNPMLTRIIENLMLVQEADANFPNLTFLPIPRPTFGEATNPCSYFPSFRYCARRPDPDHPPPAAVLHILGYPGGVSACEVACKVCREEGCDKCPSCSMHRDAKDKSITVGALWQPSRTPPSQRAYWVMNGKAYGLMGGLTFALDASKTLHGVWSPPTEVKDDWAWYGGVFVQRSN